MEANPRRKRKKSAKRSTTRRKAPTRKKSAKRRASRNPATSPTKAAANPRKKSRAKGKRSGFVTRAEFRAFKGTVAREVGGIKTRVKRTEHNLRVLDTASVQMANVLAEQWGQGHIRQFDGWQAMPSGGGSRRLPSGRKRKALGSGR